MSTARWAPNPAPDTVTVLVGGPIRGDSTTRGGTVPTVPETGWNERTTGAAAADTPAAMTLAQATATSTAARQARTRIGTPRKQAPIRWRPQANRAPCPLNRPGKRSFELIQHPNPLNGEAGHPRNRGIAAYLQDRVLCR